MSESKSENEKRSAVVSAFRKRYLEELARRPLVSDEEFMAETEVSDEEYATGLAIMVAVDPKEVNSEQD